ncbi:MULTISPECIES: hypothetical protein [Cysteiniphilum]|uniref:hypothetical protein n=1 Tax=Cysteiniphilum TaxID=2056696 RepID=UPI00177C6B63|nr:MULTISPECIES: hypothetical protein [Cysteiniphilum]
MNINGVVVKIKRHKHLVVLMFIAITAIISLYFYANNHIVASLSSGYLVSFIFWLMVIFLPGILEKHALKKQMIVVYLEFKDRILSELLWISKVHFEVKKQLKKGEIKFEYFFSEKTSSTKKRWHDVMNTLEDDLYRRDVILTEMLTLYESFVYYLLRIKSHNCGAQIRLQYLNHEILRVNRIFKFKGYDEVKYLCAFLWDMFSESDQCTGKYNPDWVISVIKKL